jgi:predicted GH43/DUF377 family glycosyl hydrolase
MKSTLIHRVLPAALMLLCVTDAFGQFVWTKDALNPVCTGMSGTWNKHLVNPCVIYNDDSLRYEMWFVGISTTNDAAWYPWRVGFAVSKDGVKWTMHPDPVLSPDPGSWESMSVDFVTVIRENGGYKMWYTAFRNLTSPNYIGYATSSDGILWTKYPGNPVFGPGTAAWEVGGPYGCTVMPKGGTPGDSLYKMWYVDTDAAWKTTNIGYATSADGLTWSRDTMNYPVLTPGASGQWDDKSVWSPKVLRINNSFYMWYGGEQIGGDQSPLTIGMATSADGITDWKKYAANPVISPSSGGWDGTYGGSSTLLRRGDTLHMWYEGALRPSESNPFRIGHATSPLVIAGIADGSTELPNQYMLGQNYPNPFNPTTVIRYQLPSAGSTRLVVFDVLGRETATLVNDVKQPGTYTVQWDASGQASGMYFYRLNAGSFTETKKMVVVR